jgi:Protein of unknown function (DUF3551)
MRYVAVMVVAGLALLAGATGAQAGPWCAWFDPFTYSCGFSSFQQCLDTVLGEGGFCARNVQEAWTAPAPKPVRNHRKPRRGD